MLLGGGQICQDGSHGDSGHIVIEMVRKTRVEENFVVQVGTLPFGGCDQMVRAQVPKDI